MSGGLRLEVVGIPFGDGGRSEMKIILIFATKDKKLNFGHCVNFPPILKLFSL
jgi:hypothetical protein